MAVTLLSYQIDLRGSRGWKERYIFPVGTVYSGVKLSPLNNKPERVEAAVYNSYHSVLYSIALE